MKKVAVLLALVASLVLMLPGAHAADAHAAGEVAGNVKIATATDNPGGTPSVTGIPTVTPDGFVLNPDIFFGVVGACNWTTYTFDGVFLNGVLSQDGAHFAGRIGVTGVEGKSTQCETTSSGAGIVNGPGGDGNLPPAQFSGTTATSSITGTFYGTYARTETYVEVTLNVSFTIQPLVGAAQSGTIEALKVRAQFTPTDVHKGSFGITDASFIGEFSSI